MYTVKFLLPYLGGTFNKAQFAVYQEATDFAHDLLENQPVGKVEVWLPNNKMAWSYDKVAIKVKDLKN